MSTKADGARRTRHFDEQALDPCHAPETAQGRNGVYLPERRAQAPASTRFVYRSLDPAGAGPRKTSTREYGFSMVSFTSRASPAQFDVIGDI